LTHRSASRWVAFASVLPLSAGMLLLGAPAALADDDVSSGQWYIDAFKIPDAAAAGYTGEGVTIAVIDSPINTDVPTLSGANIEVREPSFCLDDAGDPYPARSTEVSGERNSLHGTSVASMIAGTGDGYPGQSGVPGVASGAKVLYYAATLDAAGGGLTCHAPGGPEGALSAEYATAAAMNEAMDAGADILSVSLILNATDELVAAVARAHRTGVVVLGALPNSQLDVSGTWPGSGNGVVAVQAVDSTGFPISEDVGGLKVPNGFDWSTVSGPGVGILGQGSTGAGDWETQQLIEGTSLATPAVAGFLALVLQKYPDATGNQLIQTLIRNTGVEDHELVRDNNLGYGIASATHMLRVDPTQYPDENPLLTDGNEPSRAQIEAAPTASSTPAPGGPGTEAGFPWGIVIAVGVVALLVIIGVVVLIIILATRRSRAPDSGRS
jgi:subtilisin family serine protease